MMSPSFTLSRPHAYATKLIPSVVPLTNIISLESLMFRNFATISLVSSNASVDSSANACTAR